MDNENILLPKVSIIVPIYGTESLLSKCLDSIINQTYKNLEIICVNDCSPGNAKQIVQEFCETDNRVKYVEHSVNKGLYHARITGAGLATGDYIAFVDSDDHISVDYYRLLIEKAMSSHADIIEGRIVREYESGEKFIQNLNNILADELHGNIIKQRFFSQEGVFYHWHVIWNKIYSMKLWKQCLPYYKKQDQHLIMTEDLLFSSLLFFNANHYCSVNNAVYYYFIRSDAATGAASNEKKMLKNISDMGIVFSFVENYLKLHEDGENLQHIKNWKTSYFRLWAGRAHSEPISSSARKNILNELRSSFGVISEESEQVKVEDYYHSIVTTTWDDRLEEIRRAIADPQMEFVSFDIFDTLVVRPFYSPQDLYIFMDDYFSMIYPEGALIPFSSIRFRAEERARGMLRMQNPTWEDVNLYEIYSYIKSEYNLPHPIVDMMLEKELELELRFIERRETIFELYRMACSINKKVIFVSDMYLPQTAIEKILSKVGYDEYHQLYVSSEVRLLKNTGSLFDYVVKDLNTQANRIIHIGDNWDSDKIKAQNKGWNSWFIGKTMDLLLNKLQDKETGHSANSFDDSSARWMSSEQAQYLSVRCMLAVVANRLFDNPFISFNAQTDFNCDPFFVGYYALGMHAFGLAHWLAEESQMKQQDTMHFMARDGYLPQLVYDIVSSQYPEAAKSNYLYASRLMLLPYLLTANNQYGLELFVSLHAHTPMSILKMFDEVLVENWTQMLNNYDVKLDKTFKSNKEFMDFVDLIMNKLVDSGKLTTHIDSLSRYYRSIIQGNDAIFDLGYSGRLQTILVKLLERPVDAYFVHANKETPWMYGRRNGFQVQTYYENKPEISGILREQLFAKSAPSSVSIRVDEVGVIEPVFEDYNDHPINAAFMEVMHQGAVQFAKDMTHTFGESITTWKFRKNEVSQPLEYYIHHSQNADRLLFNFSYSDDTVHGANDRNRLTHWWDAELARAHPSINRTTDQGINYERFGMLYNRSNIVKVLFYGLFDREELKTKLKRHYASKPILLNVIITSYRSLRRVKRRIIK
ncbi:glycosyltransferase [Paenibacillus glycinis]|uniref:Glycosyltransferase n=1 Tax=Paenibacillus glycinis TaxID=2697035 RepID=A0ABW9XZC2_9BACL|nr:glycosyltransferase [Paenibacillus glycinis]NBD27567.1 glycosyltransferase [Paenibacillus glycinis]